MAAREEMEVKPLEEVMQYLFNYAATVFAGGPNKAAAVTQLRPPFYVS